MTLIDTPGIASLSTEISARAAAFLTPEDAPSAGRRDHLPDAAPALRRPRLPGRVPRHRGRAGRPPSTRWRCSRGPTRSARAASTRCCPRAPSRSAIAPTAHCARSRSTVVPIAGLVAQSARTLRQHEFEALREVARLGRDGPGAAPGLGRPVRQGGCRDRRARRRAPRPARPLRHVRHPDVGGRDPLRMRRRDRPGRRALPAERHGRPAAVRLRPVPLPGRRAEGARGDRRGRRAHPADADPTSPGARERDRAAGGQRARAARAHAALDGAHERHRAAARGGRRGRAADRRRGHVHRRDDSASPTTHPPTRCAAPRSRPCSAGGRWSGSPLLDRAAVEACQVVTRTCEALVVSVAPVSVERRRLRLVPHAEPPVGGWDEAEHPGDDGEYEAGKEQ